jgi:hypothetical protein
MGSIFNQSRLACSSQHSQSFLDLRGLDHQSFELGLTILPMVSIRLVLKQIELALSHRVSTYSWDSTHRSRGSTCANTMSLALVIQPVELGFAYLKGYLSRLLGSTLARPPSKNQNLGSAFNQSSLGLPPFARGSPINQSSLNCWLDTYPSEAVRHHGPTAATHRGSAFNQSSLDLPDITVRMLLAQQPSLLSWHSPLSFLARKRRP